MKKNFNRHLIFCLFAVLLVVLVISCANSEAVDACLTGKKYGFWWGLWHGIIAPIDFVVMLFKDNVTMYAQNNNGAWYALGFLIGSGGWGFLGGKGARRRRNRD
ncbi:MAG TPA: hypothetical protein VHI78_03320 [Bacteroidales bacterium]|jgi:hypothetical protein|nr:hypothetical protein [Bacteroidales bacterium]